MFRVVPCLFHAEQTALSFSHSLLSLPPSLPPLSFSLLPPLHARAFASAQESALLAASIKRAMGPEWLTHELFHKLVAVNRQLWEVCGIASHLVILLCMCCCILSHTLYLERGFWRLVIALYGCAIAYLYVALYLEMRFPIHAHSPSTYIPLHHITSCVLVLFLSLYLCLCTHSLLCLSSHP